MNLYPIGVCASSVKSGNYRVVRDGKFTRILDDKHCVKHGNMLILDVLAGLSAHYFKTWAFPKQKTICELLKRFYGVTMSVRTVNLHLNALERDGYIHRKRRHEYEKRSGKVLYRSTIYKICAPAMKRILRTVEGWKRWTLGKKFITDLRGELRSGVHLPFLAEHAKHSILRL